MACMASLPFAPQWNVYTHEAIHICMATSLAWRLRDSCCTVWASPREFGGSETISNMVSCYTPDKPVFSFRETSSTLPVNLCPTQTVSYQAARKTLMQFQGTYPIGYTSNGLHHPAQDSHIPTAMGAVHILRQELHQ